MLNRVIFREFDIRGRVGTELDEVTVRQIAEAFAGYAQERGRTALLVAHDNRHSSPRLQEITVEAFLQSGMDVVDLGEVITPMFYFAARHLGIDAGLMITASHNPGNDNGFKLLLGNTTIYGEEIQDIARRVEAGYKLHSERRGKVYRVDITEPYVAEIRGRVQLGPRPLKVVVDCGSGTTSLIGPRVLRELGCQVVELFCVSDADYPHHHPDPVKVENLQDLILGVHLEKADLGIGFDTDGDRLGVVDELGNIIWGDILMILFWREIGALFAGETSGHMFQADEYYGFDDAIYAAARLLRILSNSDLRLSQLLADGPKYHCIPELRLPSTETEKFRIAEQVNEHFGKRYEVIAVDGARILFPNGWGLVRPSTNAPEVIVRCEGQTEEDLESIKTELFSYLQQLGLKVQ